MGMTAYEELAKKEIIKALAEDGYPSYARIIKDLNGKDSRGFDINLTADPNVVAYMEPDKARIVVNQDLDIAQVSTVVRHEILHEFLNHQKRLLDKLADEAGLDKNKLDDMSLKELQNKLYSNQLFNIAGDYEISNRGYTDKDKQIVRSLMINGQLCRGLVTEDDHPEWADLPLEDLYDKLRKEQPTPPPGGGDGPDQDYDADKVKKSDGGGGGGQPQQPSKKSGTKIIKGTFKNGKFYDLNGKEIKH